MAESEEELKSLLMKVKEESEIVGLKLNIQKMKIIASGPITSWQIDGETMKTVTDFIFLDFIITADGNCSHEIERHFLGRKAVTNLGSILKSKDITLPTKVQSSQSYGFSSSHLWMWELDHKEGYMSKNWWPPIVLLEKTLERPSDSKNIKPNNPKGNQSWIFIGRTEAEAPILWPPNVKSWLTGKDPDAGKGWGQEKRSTEDENGWMASLTQWTWVWANFGRQWRTGKPGMHQSMESQILGHDWPTELNFVIN